MGTTAYGIEKHLRRSEKSPLLVSCVVQKVSIALADEILELTLTVLGERPHSNEQNKAWKCLSLLESVINPLVHKVDHFFSFCFRIRSHKDLSQSQTKGHHYTCLEQARNEFLKQTPTFLKESISVIAGSFVASKLVECAFSIRLIAIIKVCIFALEIFSKTAAVSIEKMKDVLKLEDHFEHSQIDSLVDRRWVAKTWYNKKFIQYIPEQYL